MPTDYWGNLRSTFDYAEMAKSDYMPSNDVAPEHAEQDFTPWVTFDNSVIENQWKLATLLVMAGIPFHYERQPDVSFIKVRVKDREATSAMIGVSTHIEMDKPAIHMDRFDLL